jgi:hypothetical protein
MLSVCPEGSILVAFVNHPSIEVVPLLLYSQLFSLEKRLWINAFFLASLVE